MAKERINVTIDETVKREAQNRDDINISGAVNQFLRDYLSGGMGQEAALIQRRERLDNELSEVEQKKRQIERELEHVERQIEEIQTDKREELEALYETEFKQELHAEHPAVRNHAQRAGMSPERFWEQYQERYGDGE
jgi:peptidoglycan hydrolase CwlO-like protein